MTERKSAVALGSDGAGFELKEKLKPLLSELGLDYRDFGADSAGPSDYPVYAKKVTDAVLSGECEKGILVCGTGIGMSMAANRRKGVYCALCGDEFSAQATREHNNANVLALGARTTGHETAEKIVRIFFSTEFSNAERHIKRVGMIDEE